ncbi:Uncharacterised protein [Segatella copri]|nr:Uncharacterised protein [Segatella copri]
MKNRISLRNYHLFASPHTGDDELAMRHHRNLCDGIAVQGRIHDYVLSDRRMVVIIIFANLQIFRFHKEFAQEHHRQDNAHNTQRISNGTAQSRTFARQAPGVLVVAPHRMPIISGRLIGKIQHKPSENKVPTRMTARLQRLSEMPS